MLQALFGRRRGIEEDMPETRLLETDKNPPMYKRAASGSQVMFGIGHGVEEDRIFTRAGN